MKNKKIIIFGSTGKLGSKLLKYCHFNKIPVETIICFKNKKKILYQSNKYKIKNTFVLNSLDNREKLNHHIKNKKFRLIYFLDYGSSSLEFIKLLINSNSRSTFAIANKEMIIAGGKTLFKEITHSKNYFIPLDSEHFSLTNSSINNDYISKIFITASGGPFYFNKNVDLKNVNLKQVLNHPKWKMGMNNSIDSSNFINKLLEIFELSTIFNIDIKKVDFFITKSAFIHSIIFYNNSSISINAFDNNMLIPIVSPLIDIFNSKKISNNKKKIFDLNNFKLEKYSDRRFQIIKHIDYIKNLNHSGQINFMLFNNLAQNLYLSNKLKYHQIPDFIIKKLKKEKNSVIFKNIDQILIYISMLQKKYEISI